MIIIHFNSLECQPALGMESGAILDEQLSASSEYDDSYHGVIKGRLRLPGSSSSVGSWATYFNNADQWLQVDLKIQGTKVSAVATQGRDTLTYEHWVTKYKLQHSNDGVNFQYYKEQGHSADKVTIYLSNRPQVSVGYSLINHAGCW